MHKGIRKINVMKLKRSGSMVSAETAIHIPEVLSRQSSDTLKKSMERKPSHPHRMLTVTKKRYHNYVKRKKSWIDLDE